ncbi:MAG: hypothetical protein HOF48_00210 [Gammaproteobacteria bacterium]|nr:hypothetical protein [Gammaproteobacteria bacterium]
MPNNFESLREIKQQYGFSQDYPLATQLEMFVGAYNQSYQQYTMISQSPANIVAQKVKHDSFSKSLNETIQRLGELFSGDCFLYRGGAGKCSPLLLEQGHSLHFSAPKLSDKNRLDNRGHQVTYRQLGGQKRREIKQATKPWDHLIQESLLMDIYGAYVMGTADQQYLLGRRRRPALSQTFVNDVLSYFSSKGVEQPLQLRPQITPLQFSSFRSVVQRYRELSE